MFLCFRVYVFINLNFLFYIAYNAKMNKISLYSIIKYSIIVIKIGAIYVIAQLLHISQVLQMIMS